MHFILFLWNATNRVNRVLASSDAAGADIKEMAGLSYAEAYGENRFKEFARLTSVRKPVSCVYPIYGSATSTQIIGVSTAK